MHQIELRNYLRTRSPNELPALAAADTRVAEAILSAPPMLTGIDEVMFGHICEKSRSSKLPIEQRKIEMLEDVTAAAGAALSMAQYAIVEASDLRRAGPGGHSRRQRHYLDQAISSRWPRNHPGFRRPA
jgi:hypothetical protein